MKNILLALSMLGMSSNLLAANPDADSIIKNISGCFEVLDSEITQNISLGEHPIVNSFANQTAKICIEDTAVGDGVSRSGRVAVRLYATSGDLINSFGYEVSDSQPRCPLCYDLNGFDGRVEYRSTLLNPTEVVLTLDWTRRFGLEVMYAVEKIEK